jgi:hypothetical protein
VDNSEFNPYAPPMASVAAPDVDASSAIYRHGNLLVMHKKAVLPAICLKTNQPSELRIKRTMYWSHPALLLLLPFALLLYVVVVLVVQQRATLQIPCTRQVASKRLRGIAIGWIGFLVGLVLLVFGALQIETVSPLVMLIGAISIVVFPILGSSMSAIVTPAKMSRNYVWLRGVAPEYLNRWSQAPVGLR